MGREYKYFFYSFIYSLAETQRLVRQYLYVCTSKASELSTRWGGSRRLIYLFYSRRNDSCVSICTFVLVKQVNWVPDGAGVDSRAARDEDSLRGPLLDDGLTAASSWSIQYTHT
jgi:hypothetical protein